MAKPILIVEDEPKNAKLLRDILHKFGYETVEAADGEQGVKIAAEKVPCVILMDIMMPKMDGLEATRRIKADARTKNIPVIAVTSSAMKGDRELTIEAGCDAYITKPIDIRDTLKIVEYYIRLSEKPCAAAVKSTSGPVVPDVFEPNLHPVNPEILTR
jgi:CheY-like chemotaxis protein